MQFVISYKPAPGVVMRVSDGWRNKTKAMSARDGTGHSSCEGGEGNSSQSESSSVSDSEDAIAVRGDEDPQIRPRRCKTFPNTPPPRPQKEKKRPKPIFLALATSKHRRLLCSSVLRAGPYTPAQKGRPSTFLLEPSLTNYGCHSHHPFRRRNRLP